MEKLNAIEHFKKCLNEYLKDIDFRRTILGLTYKKLDCIIENKDNKALFEGYINSEDINEHLILADINYIVVSENVNYFKSNDNDLLEKNNVYGSFIFLCSAMNNFGLKMKEKIEIIMNVIKMNNYVLENSKNPKEISFIKNSIFDFIDINYQTLKALKFIESNKYQLLRNKCYNELTFREKEILEECKKIEAQYCSSLEMFFTNMKKIQNSYFEKINTFNLNDIEEVCNALIDLNIDVNICINIKKEMIKEFNKRNQKDLQVIKNETKSELKIAFKEYISDSEYKKIRKEISKYFDFYKVKLIKEDISYDEIIKCASLAKKIEYDDMDIMRFFSIAKLKEKEIQTHSISNYISMYNKLCYYAEKCGFLNQLNDLKECLQEMLMTNDEQYIEWKKIFEEIMSEIINKIPSSYDYELSLVRGLK